MKTYAKWRII